MVVDESAGSLIILQKDTGIAMIIMMMTLCESLFDVVAYPCDVYLVSR